MPSNRTSQLDPRQLAAAHASGDRVVQIIAPAGSGKTSVLVERARHLLATGQVRPGQLLALTYNAAAARELRARLSAGRVAGVQARTFHAVGREIARPLLPGTPRQLSARQWTRLSALARRDTAPDGLWIDPQQAPEAISHLKLVALARADELDPTAAPDPGTATLWALYRRYEQTLAEHGDHDFDDHLLQAVRLLEDDAASRRAWQERFTHVLVDEFQDIEPAQERLLWQLAAPEQQVTVVGDPDQVLYGWRRASTRALLELDERVAGVERHVLTRNYRCPKRIVAASGRLIAHNNQRVPVALAPAPGAGEGRVDVVRADADAAAIAADLLTEADRQSTVVLARTSRLLRAVATECAQRGISIDAAREVTEPSGAPAAALAALRLVVRPRAARADDVALCFGRHPHRGLPHGAAAQLAALLRSGLTRGGRGKDWRRRPRSRTSNRWRPDLRPARRPGRCRRTAGDAAPPRRAR